jgi:hypothetical protein
MRRTEKMNNSYWKGALREWKIRNMPETTARALDRLRATLERESTKQLPDDLRTAGETYAPEILVSYDQAIAAATADMAELESLSDPKTCERLQKNKQREAARNTAALRAYDVKRCRALANGEDLGKIGPPPEVENTATEDRARVWSRSEELAKSAYGQLNKAEGLLLSLCAQVLRSVHAKVESAMGPALPTLRALLTEQRREVQFVLADDLAIEIRREVQDG